MVKLSTTFILKLSRLCSLVSGSRPLSSPRLSSKDGQLGSTSIGKPIVSSTSSGLSIGSSYALVEPNNDIYLDLKKDIDDMKLQMNEIMELIHERYKIHEPPISFDEPEGSEDDTEVIFDEVQFLRQQSTAHVTPLPLAYTPPPLCLATMEPLDALLMGDEVISTTPTRENSEFIKSSVDYLVPILKESEVTSVSGDLECSMPNDTPPLP
ncbi:hypothetical protein Tco_0846895 [Tanacetum coccineum]